MDKEFHDFVKNMSEANYNKKHFKGYIYDSLMYRYIVARKQMAELEFLRNKQDPYNSYQRQANRDIMRFAQILNEAIGEHD